MSVMLYAHGVQVLHHVLVRPQHPRKHASYGELRIKELAKDHVEALLQVGHSPSEDDA